VIHLSRLVRVGLALCVAAIAASCGGGGSGPTAGSTFTVTGSVTGLNAGASVTVSDNSGATIVVGTNRSFTFATPISYGGSYQVVITTQPVGQTCSVVNFQGSGVTADVTTVQVTCAEDTYTISGTASGLLAGQRVTLTDNGVDALAVGANGVFTFAGPVNYGGAYAVQVASQPLNEICTVAQGAGQGVNANVSAVSLTCSADRYTIGGSVSGLDIGQQLTLDDNGADPLTITANGMFTFATPVAYAGSYGVTVGTQPTHQICSVTSGTGSGSGVSANVSSIALTCSNDRYVVGGTVNGLLNGQMLTLLDNGGDAKTIVGGGSGTDAFTFATPVSYGASYQVTVGTQPVNQICSVSAGTGSAMAVSSNVSNVALNCSTDHYTIGGTVSGLDSAQQLTLIDNGADSLTLAANGAFTFATPVAYGASYAVTVGSQPANQVCVVTAGTASGSGIGANVNTVAVTCTNDTYTIGGTVTGLSSGQTVTLLNNGGDARTVTGNGSGSDAFTFATRIPYLGNYAVTIGAQPSGEICAVSGGVGSGVAANIAGTVVSCRTALTVGGTVSGLLPRSAFVLQLNGGSNLTVNANGAATFGTKVASQSTYAVTVLAQPNGQSCAVTNGSGVATVNVVFNVACAANPGSGAGAGSATLVAIPAATGNSVPIVFDGGNLVTGYESNRPFVSITLCTPGTTGSARACQTIDHVVLDTGSYGLVLSKSAISSSLNLPIVADATGNAIGSCIQYGGGYSWGSVRLADVYVGAEVAKTVMFADDGDQPGGASVVPSSCSSGGTALDFRNENGIWGIGVLGDNNPDEFSCSSGSCTAIATNAYPIANVAAQFNADHNGLIVQVPAVVGAANYYSAASPIVGTLTFGLGTQSNNTVTGATPYATNTSGDFSTTYNGTSYPSFLDTGSGAIYFNDSIPVCATHATFYCPANSPLALNATNTAASGGASGRVNFNVYSADAVFGAGEAILANTAQPFSGFQGFSATFFDWGLPFFFGRTVYVGFQGSSTPVGTGPFWAY